MRKRILSLFLIISIISSFMLSLPVIASAETIASGTCGSNLTWELASEGTLSISGSGSMSDYNYSNSPWHSLCEEILNVVLSEGITSTGYRA